MSTVGRIKTGGQINKAQMTTFDLVCSTEKVKKADFFHRISSSRPSIAIESSSDADHEKETVNEQQKSAVAYVQTEILSAAQNGPRSRRSQGRLQIQLTEFTETGIECEID